ncbi:MAG: hypothetical protein ACE14M_14225 [Terriglobales bacterium]
MTEKKKPQYDPPKGITVPRQAHKRYEKAQQLRAARAEKKKARRG